MIKFWSVLVKQCLSHMAAPWLIHTCSLRMFRVLPFITGYRAVDPRGACDWYHQWTWYISLEFATLSVFLLPPSLKAPTHFLLCVLAGCLYKEHCPVSSWVWTMASTRGQSGVGGERGWGASSSAFYAFRVIFWQRHQASTTKAIWDVPPFTAGPHLTGLQLNHFCHLSLQTQGW